ncbi:MAG: hypothetical protein ABIB71_00375 [Candidatus Woesearchaeota archaeon]
MRAAKKESFLLSTAVAKGSIISISAKNKSRILIVIGRGIYKNFELRYCYFYYLGAGLLSLVAGYGLVS